MIGELIKINPGQSPEPGKARKKAFFKRRWVHVVLGLMLLITVGGYLGAMAYLRPFEDKAETYDMSLVAKLEQSSIVYDRNRAEIGRLANENRVIIPYLDMPKHLIEALVATEDQRFWTHDGVDYRGIARAAKDNLLGGGNDAGGQHHHAAAGPEYLRPDGEIEGTEDSGNLHRPGALSGFTGKRKSWSIT